MAGRKPNVMTAIVLVGLAASLMFLYQARAGLAQRDEQVRRLRDRTAHLEGEVVRPSFTAPFGLTAGDRDAYLSLGYKEFDATSGSGHRRLRDQPQSPARAGELIEAYLERHPELPPDQWVILEFHAAQLFAMGGINELAITHIDRVRCASPART